MADHSIALYDVHDVFVHRVVKLLFLSLKNVTLKEMMRQLIKFAETKDVLIWQ